MKMTMMTRSLLGISFPWILTRDLLPQGRSSLLQFLPAENKPNVLIWNRDDKKCKIDIFSPPC